MANVPEKYRYIFEAGVAEEIHDPSVGTLAVGHPEPFSGPPLSEEDKFNFALAEHPEIASKVDALRADTRRASAAHNGANAEHMASIERWNDARREFAQAQHDARRRGSFYPEVIDARERQVAEEHRSRQEAMALVGEASKVLSEAREVEEVVTDYLKKLGFDALTSRAVRLPGDLRRALSNARAEQARLHAEGRTVKDLPPPKRDVLARARGNLEKAFSTAPLVTVKPDGRVEFPLRAVDVTGRAHVKALPDPLALFFSDKGNREAALAEVDRQVDALYAGVSDTATPDDKKKRLDKIRAQILESQRLEAAACWSLREQGESFVFRPELDPRAILMVDGPPPPPRRNI